MQLEEARQQAARLNLERTPDEAEWLVLRYPGGDWRVVRGDEPAPVHEEGTVRGADTAVQA